MLTFRSKNNPIHSVGLICKAQYAQAFQCLLFWNNLGPTGKTNLLLSVGTCVLAILELVPLGQCGHDQNAWDLVQISVEELRHRFELTSFDS